MAKEDILLVVVVLAVLIALALLIDFFNKPKEEIQPVVKEKTMEEILKGLSAPPASENQEVLDEILKSLSAPKGSGKVSEEVLLKLSAPKQ
ncbi:MAG: hypothetical protein Q8P63_00460 [Candidatus Nealsonbacteria bacterium]|nr:hypothetical protein [Candidatus Nealsonbacteria bacterium]